MLEALAAIPPLQSAIRIDGEDSGCVRIMLDLYFDDPAKIVDLTALRGSELVISLRKTT
tara:strand:+ start:6423 stop:6599 length:177 start_codon:yes stop_codon:yes gene_type:complete